jgi:O-acetyl-ADP-ribose deacetylase (regulator of RNase III)
MKIKFITGDVTNPISTGMKIIPQCVNDIGAMGSGVAKAIYTKWPIVREEYFKWFRSQNNWGLGAVQFIQVESDIIIANIIGQRNIISNLRKGEIPIRYGSIERGLIEVADKAIELNASIHTCRIGCGLAKGNWDIIENIIINNLCNKNIPVTVYDPA